MSRYLNVGSLTATLFVAPYKLFTAPPSVSTVSPIYCDSYENGISGITSTPFASRDGDTATLTGCDYPA